MTDPMELVGRLEAKNAPGHINIIDSDTTEELLDLLTEAAACIREMVEWRPIETAPMDGTIVLTYGSLHNDHAPYGVGETPTVKISQFSPEHGAWCCDAWGSHEPVWWKPLPLPPAPGAEDE